MKPDMAQRCRQVASSVLETHNRGFPRERRVRPSTPWAAAGRSPRTSRDRKSEIHPLRIHASRSPRTRACASDREGRCRARDRRASPLNQERNRLRRAGPARCAPARDAGHKELRRAREGMTPPTCWDRGRSPLSGAASRVPLGLADLDELGQPLKSVARITTPPIFLQRTEWLAISDQALPSRAAFVVISPTLPKDSGETLSTRQRRAT